MIHQQQNASSHNTSPNLYNSPPWSITVGEQLFLKKWTSFNSADMIKGAYLTLGGGELEQFLLLNFIGRWEVGQ